MTAEDILAAAALLRHARRRGGAGVAAIGDDNLPAAALLVRLGLATAHDEDDGLWLRLKDAVRASA